MWVKRINQISAHFLFSTQKKVNYSFKFGTFLLPHPQKQYKGGEDALHASKQVLIVADGVGGWADSGVDPALYSKKLVKIMEELIQKQPSKYIADPKNLVNEAVNLNKQTGSTTVCILTLCAETGLIRSYYLGDSVFAIARPDKQSISVAPDQQIQFNFPVQVGTNGFSPLQGIYKQYNRKDNNKQEETIKQSDFLVVASDGLWDNMHLDLIYYISTGKTPQPIHTLQERAKVMANTTKMLYSMEDEYQSPFHLKAKQAKLRYPKQGKPDDVSIIIAQIVAEEL